MCSDPVHIDGQEFSCRKCNECINARKNTWVARAMAEKSMSAETFSVTLTYDDTTQENRDAAKTFEYRHVSLWLKRLRRAIEYKTGQTGALRYLVAGERGSDKGRCHWHVILFCNADILTLGKLTAWPSGRKVTARGEKISEGKRRKRLNWSLWPHGFITFQEPDQWGMEYALAYALKDQFNIVSAQGTMREAHVSRTAAGMFRMSKTPPIGYPYLEQRCDKFEEAAQLPTSTKIPVPEYKGYWWPNGMAREYYLDRLREINRAYIANHGANAPQWAALVHSVQESDKDWERLLYGEENEEDEQEEVDDLKRALALRVKEFEATEARRRCGGLAPCRRCVSGLTENDYDNAKSFARSWAKKHGSFAAADAAHRKAGRCNPYCTCRELPAQQRAFKK